MEILDLFGFDWKLLVAQLVNFAIVVAVLWFFALKPLSKKMQERNTEIEKGLSDAKTATERLDEVEKDIKEKLLQNKSEAADIITKAKRQTEDNRQADINKAKQEVANIIAKAKEQIASEKSNMISEVKLEVAEMIVVALEKILSKGLSKDIDKKYIEDALKNIK